MTRTSRLWRKKFKMTSEYGKNLPSSWIGRITLVNMDILPKAVYKFNAIPIKISSKFFIKLVKLFLNSSEITKKNSKSKIVYISKSSSRGISILDLRPHYKAIVLNTAWSLYSDRQVNQCNRNDVQAMNPHTYGHLIFDKELNPCSGKKSLLNKQCRLMWRSAWRMKIYLCYYHPQLYRITTTLYTHWNDAHFKIEKVLLTAVIICYEFFRHSPIQIGFTTDLEHPCVI